MDLIKTMYARHTVRHFDNKALNKTHAKALRQYIKDLNKESGLHFILVTNEPKSYGGKRAKISNITGCVNYIVLAGKKAKDLKEKVGYYGQKLVLKMQQMNIASCWTLLTCNKIKTAYKLNKREKWVIQIAIGYGLTKGKAHESKKFAQVVTNRGKLPQWFIYGVKMALLAPTGVNKQGFTFTLLENNVVQVRNRSLCKDIDLGIIKYCFEIGAGKTKFTWSK